VGDEFRVRRLFVIEQHHRGVFWRFAVNQKLLVRFAAALVLSEVAARQKTLAQQVVIHQLDTYLIGHRKAAEFHRSARASPAHLRVALAVVLHIPSGPASPSTFSASRFLHDHGRRPRMPTSAPSWEGTIGVDAAN
jgi:hypothetical protein